jgi:acetylornithine deacetylase
MDTVDAVRFARALIDIDSTTGKEREAGEWLVAKLEAMGYAVTRQPVVGNRFNVIAVLDQPDIVLSTHYDCVPPFFPSHVGDGKLFGRGACDAKGILAAQVAAAGRLRADGRRDVGLLFVVGEERGSEGAAAANAALLGSKFLVDGEPTDNRLATGTRGILRVRLHARGRAGHSSASSRRSRSSSMRSCACGRSSFLRARLSARRPTAWASSKAASRRMSCPRRRPQR